MPTPPSSYSCLLLHFLSLLSLYLVLVSRKWNGGSKGDPKPYSAFFNLISLLYFCRTIISSNYQAQPFLICKFINYSSAIRFITTITNHRTFSAISNNNGSPRIHHHRRHPSPRRQLLLAPKLWAPQNHAPTTVSFTVKPTVADNHRRSH